MPHHARYIAITLCVILTGSVSLAAPKKSKRAKAAAKAERIAFADDDIGDTRDVDAPVKLRKRKRAAAPAPAQDWNLAIGPYLWMASVDANVAVGSSNVGAGIDFFEIKRYARYGAMVAAEARHGRLSMSTDLMYGVVGLEGGKEVGPLMVALDGTASSLLVDGGVGYMVTGGDDAVLSLEARAGVRYQRTSVTAEVRVGNSDVAGITQVETGADGTAGARVILRPSRRLYLAGMADLGVIGTSSFTWSASADASVRITSRVLLSVGYRRLMIDRAPLSITMHGPRATLQLLF